MSKQNYDVIIIGAGTAGLTASIYVARAGKSVIVLEKESFGGQIIYSPKVENFPTYKEISGADYADALVQQAENCGVETDVCEVLSIAVHNGINGKNTFTVKTDYGEYEGKAVIIAGGARHRHLGVAREEEFMGQGVSFCALCDGAFYKDEAVMVVGGGNTAFQDVRLLSETSKKVYWVHRRDAFRADATDVAKLTNHPRVELCMNSVVDGLLGDGALDGVRIKDVVTGETRDISVKGLFVAVGQVPATESFKDLVECTQNGYIIAGEDTKTSVPGIFTAGDIRTKTVRQLTTAASDGSIAAVAATEYIS